MKLSQYIRNVSIFRKSTPKYMAKIVQYIRNVSIYKKSTSQYIWRNSCDIKGNP